MKVSAVIVNPHKKVQKSKDLPLSLLLSISSVLLGLISGTLLYCFFKESLYSDVFSLFTNFFSDFTQNSSLEILSGLMVSELPYIFMMLIFSFSAIGFPFTILFTFIKSLAPTLLFSHLYFEYGLKGAEYVFLVLLPGEIVCTFGVLLMTQSCFNLSKFLSKNVKTTRGESSEETRNFTLKFAVSTVIILISNVITLLTVACFSSLFAF